MLTNNLHCEDGPATREVKADSTWAMDKQSTLIKSWECFTSKCLMHDAYSLFTVDLLPNFLFFVYSWSVFLICISIVVIIN